MITYSVIFKALSPLTKIPDSQAIFGAFCYTYKNLYGEEELLSLLKKEKNEKPLFLISSMFIKDTLPFPFDFVPQHSKSELTLDDTRQFKKFKKVKFFSKKIFKLYQEDKESFQKNFYNKFNSSYKITGEVLMLKEENICLSDYIKYDVRVRNNTNESELFQDNIMYINNNTLFEFYIKIIDESDNDVEKIKNTIKEMKYITIGGMKSIGYNMFSFESISEEKGIISNNPSVLISKAIGDNSIDIEKSFYKINVNNAKFNSKTNLYRKQAVCFLEGSVMETPRDYIGAIVVENDGKKDNYRNLLGFLL